ncbi:hypothetical protein C8F04DRAFT_1089064 [Mycena alexandri]|uniref:Uncharacterized protein n=1 Tax=Mycena alexandri TaxID=1745969 RepID=A0AAD6T2U0_9AGAR|nr:hypothetical protein C8F04DRAFT_1089064 [Mycena alexandri]
MEVVAIRHLSLQQYHTCCTSVPLFRHEAISTSATVTLAAVRRWPMGEQFGSSHGLVGARDVEIINCGWGSLAMPPDVFDMTDSSTRFNATEVSERAFRLYFQTSAGPSIWLSQANHNFHRLQVIDNYADYAVIDRIDFCVRILPSASTPPTGYLFLCPPSAFRADSSSFRWPDSPAYWSFDPLGVERLTAEEAKHVGFPSMHLTAVVWGRWWDASVYTGLRQFHAAKGFDPDGQDVARHLGYPLYELSGEMAVSFARVEDQYSEEEDPSDQEESSDVDSLLDQEDSSGAHHGPPPEATTLESTEPSELLEPSMSRAFKVISNIKLVLILFLALGYVQLLLIGD